MLDNKGKYDFIYTNEHIWIMKYIYPPVPVPEGFDAYGVIQAPMNSVGCFADPTMPILCKSKEEAIDKCFKLARDYKWIK